MNFRMIKVLKDWWPTAFLGFILFALLVLRWHIATVKIFDPDELVHLHTAWLMSHGSLPYRDFFTAYPPTFYLLLSPLVTLFPSSDFLPVAVRQIFFFIFLGSMFLFYRLIKGVVGREFSLLFMILVASSIFFVERGVEIRPDFLVIFLWLLSAFWLSGKKKKYFLAGAAAGLMATLTQKSVFMLAAAVVLAKLTAWVEASSGKPKERWPKFFGSLLRFGGGLAVFPLAVFLYIWQNNLLGYLPDFLVKYPLLIGKGYQWDHPWYHLGFVADFTDYNYFYYFYKGSLYWLRSSQFIWIAAVLLSVFWIARNILARKAADGSRTFFLFFLGSGLFFSSAYLLTIPMKLPQYWLIPAPFVMLSLVFGLYELTKLNKYLRPLIFLVSGLGLAVLTVELWTVWPKDLKTNNNFRQRANIAAVLAWTKPTDTGYDGVGSYLFRHDCFYFSLSLPQEIPGPIFKDIMGTLVEGKCDFVLKGPFSHWVDWNAAENDYVYRHFTPLKEDPDLFIRNR